MCNDYYKISNEYLRKTIVKIVMSEILVYIPIFEL